MSLSSWVMQLTISSNYFINFLFLSAAEASQKTSIKKPVAKKTFLHMNILRQKTLMLKELMNRENERV